MRKGKGSHVTEVIDLVRSIRQPGKRPKQRIWLYMEIRLDAKLFSHFPVFRLASTDIL